MVSGDRFHSTEAHIFPPITTHKHQISQWEFRLPFYHAGATRLTDVGAQLWNGSLLMMDWLIHQQHHQLVGSSDLVVDLGAGVGCTSVIAALCGAGRVFVTDRWRGLTAACAAANVARWCVRFCLPEDSLVMRTLDWANPPAVIGYSEEGALIGCSEAEALIGCSEEGELQQYEWTVAERKRLGWVDADGGSRERSRLKLIMAADAVYDTDATEDLLRTVCNLLEAAAAAAAMDVVPARAVFTVERRRCFTLDELSTTARAYDHFTACLRALDGYQPQISLRADEDNPQLDFEYHAYQIPTDEIPCFVRTIGNRGDDLFLWCLQLRPCTLLKE